MNDGFHNMYVEAVRTLWPEGPHPQLLRHRAPRQGETSFRLVPNAERARLMVPADNATAAARALLRFSAAVGVRERAKRVGMATALKAGGHRLLSHRIDVATRTGSLVDSLARDLGGPLDVSMTLGPARANRKPVLQLFDRSGRSVAFAKVGYSPTVRPHVLREHEALRTLAESGLPQYFEIPQVLGLNEWSGMPTLVMSSLRTRTFARSQPEEAIPVRGMEMLSSHFDEGLLPLSEVPLWNRLVSQRGDIVEAEKRQRICAAIDRLAECASGTALPVGAWHGDWTPWNMGWRGGRLQLWDWERFETGVPLGMDRVHYAINSAFVGVGISAEGFRRGVKVADMEKGAPGSIEHTVVGVYLVTILMRYLTGDRPPEGPVAQRTAVLTDALSEWVS